MLATNAPSEWCSSTSLSKQPRGASSAAYGSSSGGGGGSGSAGRRTLSTKTNTSTTFSKRSNTTQMSDVFKMLGEQDVTRTLHNLDRQHRMKDGAPRVLFWSSSLKLPNNHDAFRTLALRRVNPVVAGHALREVKGLLAFARDERCTARLWSCLIVHEPKLSRIPFVPYLCVAVCRGVPTNPICAFETVMHLLNNLCSEWIHKYPEPPYALLHRIDRFLETHPKLSPLWSFFNDDHLEGGCSMLDYLWVPLQTFLLLNLPAEAWLHSFDDVVCSPDGPAMFYAMVVALLWQLKEAFFTCNTREQVLAVLGTEISEPKAIEQMLRRSRLLAPSIMVPMEPIAYLPECGAYYPLLHVGGRPPVPEKVDKAAKLHQIEVDQSALERRLAVEFSTLTLSADMKRFHDSLAHLGPSDHLRHEAAAHEGSAATRPAASEFRSTSTPQGDGGFAPPPAYRHGANSAGALSPSNPLVGPDVRLCSLVMEGPSLPVEDDISQPGLQGALTTGAQHQERQQNGGAQGHPAAVWAPAHPEPPLPIVNSLSPQEDRSGSLVPPNVVRAVALMLASEEMTRRRSASRAEGSQEPNHADTQVFAPAALELSKSLSPNQRGASCVTATASGIGGGTTHPSANVSVGYTSASLPAGSRTASTLPKW